MTLHDYRPVCPNFRLWTDGESCTRCLGGHYTQVVRHRCLEGSRWRSVAAAAEAYTARRLRWYDDVATYLAPIRFLRDRVVEGGLAADRIRVVPNLVVLPDRIASPAHPPIVAYTGRLVEEKGLHVLLDAARRLPAGVRVRVTGSGRLAADAASRVEQERLPVDLLGSGTPAQVAEELQQASVAVLPSTWWENCPMSILEAGASGVPVVASDVGGIPELVEDGTTGVLVTPGDAAALAGAIRGLLEEPDHGLRMGVAARERVRLRHDPAVHIRAVLSAYREAVDRAASRSRS